MASARQTASRLSCHKIRDDHISCWKLLSSQAEHEHDAPLRRSELLYVCSGHFGVYHSHRLCPADFVRAEAVRHIAGPRLVVCFGIAEAEGRPCMFSADASLHQTSLDSHRGKVEAGPVVYTTCTLKLVAS